MTRRWTVLVVWIALALLPMRGFAHAVMLGTGAVGASSVTQIAETVLPPCHVAATDAQPASAGCQMCDLCHGVTAPASAPAAVAEPQPQAPPQSDSSLDAGRQQPDGPFRPPRA
ncbi:hypothetical protein [Rivibacter subsaxonicus]|nr:hypothetical protein [Rivibacter subsaxonicus]